MEGELGLVDFWDCQKKLKLRGVSDNMSQGESTCLGRPPEQVCRRAGTEWSCETPICGRRI
jgi:hypothetical protein